MLKKIFQVIIVLIMSVGFLNSCGTSKFLPSTDKNIVIKDSLIIKDSTRLVDSIVYVQIPREKVMDIISQIDTSRLETSVATSVAYVDTNSLMIIHSLENKDTVIQERIVYQDRYITKAEIAYRDSIVIEKVPVEVKVEKKVYPKTYWWLLGFFVITLGIVIVKIYLRFKK
jgi:hypothetical protein